jgi:hypothetical protein
MGTTRFSDAVLRCCHCDHHVTPNGHDWRCAEGCRCTMRGCVLDEPTRRLVESRRPTRVNSVTITPADRVDRGNHTAWEQAVAGLAIEYDAICASWANKAAQPVLRLVLEMERP